MKQIVEYLLERHVGISSKRIYFVADQLDFALEPSQSSEIYFFQQKK
jgi:hypothetical protein